MRHEGTEGANGMPKSRHGRAGVATVRLERAPIHHPGVRLLPFEEELNAFVDDNTGNTVEVAKWP